MIVPAQLCGRAGGLLRTVGDEEHRADHRALAVQSRHAVRLRAGLPLHPGDRRVHDRRLHDRRLVALARRYGAALAVDDAHAGGVLGRRGAGTAEHFGLTWDTDLIVGTFSKSLASIGGFVAGEDAVLHYLKHHCRPLIFTAALPAANTAGVLAALRVLRDGAAAAGGPVGQHPPNAGGPARPWLRHRADRDADHSGADRIDGRHVPLLAQALRRRRLHQPGRAARGRATQRRLRASLMATHTAEQIDVALEAFATIGRELGVLS